MAKFPILTSGRFLLDRQEIDDPREPGDEGDWAHMVVLDIADRDELSLAGDYWNSGYDGFLATGKTAGLEAFEDQRIAGYPLVASPDLIEEFAAANPGFDPGPLYQP